MISFFGNKATRWRSFALYCLLFLLAATLPLGAVTPAFAESKKTEKAEKKEHSEKGEKGSKKKKIASKKKKKKEGVEEVEEVSAKGSEEPVSNETFAADLIDTASVDAVLLLDSSRSMLRTDPNKLRNQGAKLFVRFLTEADHVGVIQFDTESKVILDLQPVNPNDLTPVDTAIDSVSTEGGFTDIEAGVDAALKLLEEKGRSNAVKTVILLSDGKMDPHPSRGTGEELTKKLKEVDLPAYKHRGVKIYTLSLSDEADKELLGSIADLGGGLHWFASDATTVHIKFSDLFLALKQPQVVPLEGAGFEIDNGVQEATFYIKHENGPAEIKLRDPRGQEVSSVSLLAGLKWFKSELFDIVTIRNPAPGKWAVEGIENPEGFATLLTDLKLQVKWPAEHINLGDSVALNARLMNKEEVFIAAGTEDVLFFNFKLVNGNSREVVASGNLSDKGDGADQKAGDGIYAANVKVDHEGQNVLLVSVTSPTFTRQQSIPFKVSGNLITVELHQGDEFAQEEPMFRVLLSEEGRKISKREVKLLAKQAEGEKIFSVPLKESKTEKGEYTAEAKAIPGGKYEVFARITWTEDKKEESQQSTSIEFESSNQTEEALAEPEEETHYGLYALFWLLSLVWGSALGFVVVSRFKSGKDRVQMLKPYKMSEELEAKLSALRGRASPERREPTAEDLEMREVLIAGYGVSVEATDGGAVATEAGEPADFQEGGEAVTEGGEEPGQEEGNSEEQS